jgi:hypothetical protein
MGVRVFRNIEFHESDETDNDILVSMTALNLPSEYVDFIRSVGGGHPSPNAFKYLDESWQDPQVANAAIIASMQVDACHPNASRRQVALENIEFFSNVLIPQRVERLFGTESFPTSPPLALAAMQDTDAGWTKYLWPIGRDDGSSLLTLSLFSADYGCIYNCNPSDFAGNESPDEMGHFLVAMSFVRFLDKLSPARLWVRKGFTPLPRHVEIFRLSEFT